MYCYPGKPSHALLSPPLHADSPCRLAVHARTGRLTQGGSRTLQREWLGAAPGCPEWLKSKAQEVIGAAQDSPATMPRLLHGPCLEQVRHAIFVIPQLGQQLRRMGAGPPCSKSASSIWTRQRWATAVGARVRLHYWQLVPVAILLATVAPTQSRTVPVAARRCG